MIMTDPEVSAWVLVKGWHDSGNVEAVYGPFTKDQADWLIEFGQNGINNWTAIELKQWPDVLKFAVS